MLRYASPGTETLILQPGMKIKAYLIVGIKRGMKDEHHNGGGFRNHEDMCFFRTATSQHHSFPLQCDSV